jgi:ferredoxin
MDSHDAVVIAAGDGTQTLIQGSSLQIRSESGHGVASGAERYKSSQPKVFATGGATKPNITIVDALARGKGAAAWIDWFLKGEEGSGPVRRFHFHLGRLQEGDILEFLKSATDRPRLIPAAATAGTTGAGFNQEEAAAEASRCFQCDCAKKDSCRLRSYAEQYEVRRRVFHSGQRARFQRILQHPTIVFEPGKCIKCGICVRISAAEEEELGLAFLDRGYEIRIGAPFGDHLSRALQHSADHCVRSCPTGALAFKRRPKRMEE